MTQKFKETETGMIPEEWNIVKFKEILIDGTKNGIYKQKEFHGHGSKIVNMGELFAYPRLYSVPMKRLELTDSEIKKFSLKENDLIFARRSLVAEGAGKCSIVREVNEPTVFESSIIRARPNPKKANSLYLYYLFNSKYGLYLLNTIRRQVAVAGITGKDLQDLQIPLPSLPEQEVIANVFSSLDDKIELNNKMNKTLEQIAQALFKRWFIDFEFPDENGNPYKSSGGRMVDSELGEIPEGWEVGTLGNIIEIFDFKRIPLANREREKRKGKYPYYGASSIMDYIDDYIFDGIYLLMGEDGTVIDDDGYPILQYIWNKFWVNNHAHVLKGKSPYSTEYLYLLLKTIRVQHIVTGAVQPKINQKNLRELQVLVPTRESLMLFNSTISSFFEIYRKQKEEIEIISSVYDSLLPKLMSGKIRVGC